MSPRVERALIEGVFALEDVGLRYAVVGGQVDHWVKLLDESIGGMDVSERLAEARRRAAKN